MHVAIGTYITCVVVNYIYITYGLYLYIPISIIHCVANNGMNEYMEVIKYHNALVHHMVYMYYHLTMGASHGVYSVAKICTRGISLKAVKLPTYTTCKLTQLVVSCSVTTEKEFYYGIHN